MAAVEYAGAGFRVTRNRSASAGRCRRSSTGESANARSRGARALEGYPINTTRVIDEELHVGTVGTFATARFVEVSHPTERRVVMRVDF